MEIITNCKISDDEEITHIPQSNLENVLSMNTSRPKSPLTIHPELIPKTVSIIEKTPEEIVSVENWNDFDLKSELLRGIYCNGFDTPSSIQKTAILPIIQERDIIGQAQSGSGKTGTFTIGTLQRIDVSQKTTQAIILAPTHELVKQIASVVSSIGSCMEGLVVKTMIGGTSVSEDVREVTTNIPHVIIGCTGRIFDMLQRRAINPQNIRILVMDEADELLSEGFKDHIYQICQFLNEKVQIALFSATMSEDILRITDNFMRNPVRIIMKSEELTLKCIQQFYIAVQTDVEKYDMVKELFSNLIVSQCIIYVNSIGRVSNLYEALTDEGFSVCCIHGSMSKDERDKALNEFRKGAYRVLISSNVTARGIDVQQVSTVINFDIPRDVNTYLHRIGRGGRWGRKGLAINFITRKDVPTMKYIESHFDITITEFPSNFNFVM
jgi:translation initiation factor 4A